MKDWTDNNIWIVKFRDTLKEMNQYMSETDEFIAVLEFIKSEMQEQINTANNTLKGEIK